MVFRTINWKGMTRVTASPHQCPVAATKMMGSSVVTSMELFAQLGHWGGFLTSSTKVVVLLTVVVWSTVVILSGLGGHN